MDYETIKKAVLALLKIVYGVTMLLFGYSGEGSPQPVWQLMSDFSRDPCSLKSGLPDYIFQTSVVNILGIVILIIGAGLTFLYAFRAYLYPIHAIVVGLISRLTTLMRGHRQQHPGYGHYMGETSQAISLPLCIALIILGSILYTSEIGNALIRGIANFASGLLLLGTTAIINLISFVIVGHGVCSV